MQIGKHRPRSTSMKNLKMIITNNCLCCETWHLARVKGDRQSRSKIHRIITYIPVYTLQDKYKLFVSSFLFTTRRNLGFRKVVAEASYTYKGAPVPIQYFKGRYWRGLKV